MVTKILICCNVYPPHFIGGAELIAHAHAKKLQELGYSVTIFTGDIQEGHNRHSLRREDYDGLRVFRVCLTFEDFQIEKTNFHHRVVEEHFVDLLKELSPDVVHFHNIIGLSTRIIHIAKLHGIKTLMTLHDHWGFCLKNTLIRTNGTICHEYNRCSDCLPFVSDQDIHQIPIQIRKDIISLHLKDIDVFISPSQYLADAYITAGFPMSKFHVIWNGIDVNHFSHIEKKRCPDRVRFTFIGHFGRHKGIHILLDALSFLSNNKDRYEVNLIGSGDIIEECKEKVCKMELQSVVKFWGKIKNIDDAYRETDVLILPSIWPENQPVTITEAMASRKPVIASNVGGVPELVEDGKTGYLFEVGKSEELAQKMMEFIIFPEKIHSYGNAGYAKIASYTVESQVKKILLIYDSQPQNSMKAEQSELLIACFGKQVSFQSFQAINTFGENMHSNFRFVMGYWLQLDHYRKVKVLWVVDPNTTFEDITIGLRNGVPLLVPDNHIALKNLCITAKCGLYYKDAVEAQACLDYLIRMEEERCILGKNGMKFISRNLSEN
ncbi:glycosyltransferase family 4 protein [Methanospirillum sp.]